MSLIRPTTSRLAIPLTVPLMPTPCAQPAGYYNACQWSKYGRTLVASRIWSADALGLLVRLCGCELPSLLTHRLCRLK
jgi:hypothetical protein